MSVGFGKTEELKDEELIFDLCQACRLIAEEVLLSSLFTVDKLLRICAIGGVAAPVR